MSLLYRKAVQSLPAHNNIQELADRFRKYFISKIEMIRQVLNTNSQENTNYIQLRDITMLPTESFNSFSPATEDEIRKLIIKSSDGTCFLDPVPTRLVKAYIDILLPTIASLQTTSQSQIFNFYPNW